MPRESWSYYWKGKPFDDKRKKSSPDQEPDTTSGSSERPHAAEPETEPRHEDARERGAGPHERAWEFGSLLEDASRSPEFAGMDNMAKKKRLKQLLREEKYQAQGVDYERVKAMTDAGKSTPWRTNTEWKKINKTGREGRPIMRFWRHEGEYKTAWRDLRQWAQGNNVWEPNDEREFIKETGGRAWTRRETAKETARNVGLNIAVAGLYGIGYALAAPWKAFELGLKYAQIITGDEAYTRGMMEKMFRKDREKTEKGGTKKEQPDRGKEEKTRKDVKAMTLEYLNKQDSQENIALKDKMIYESKLESLKDSDKYKKASPAERIILEGEVEKKTHTKELWRDIRIDWVKEDIWNEVDEKSFFEKMGYDYDKGYDQTHVQDFLTEGEWDSLKRDKDDLSKKEATLLNTNTKPQTIENIKKAMPDLEEKIKKIENRAKSRFELHTWPPYYQEKGRSRRRRQQEPGIDTEDDET